jgi:sugar phosphate isomerase/epimerase
LILTFYNQKFDQNCSLNLKIMKTKSIDRQKSILVSVLIIFLGFVSCISTTPKKALVFNDYPNLKMGLSTQNFLKVLPFNVAGLTEIIEYASAQGYQYVEVRDQFVDLSISDCKALAEVAGKNKIDVIYVFNKNPLDTGFYRVFDKALANVLVFQGPGILRTLSSKTEFDADPGKKGWSKDEFTKLASISDSCAQICKSKNIRLLFENSNEAFFGDSLNYFGLADLLAKTSYPGLQLDIGNLFRKTSRVPNDPERVLKYLSSIGDRWVETHLKTVLGGEAQTILTENPLPIEKVIDLMGRKNIQYVTLELTTVEGKQLCLDNHTKSLQFLRDKGILKK